jgi:hypothetical protein
MMSELSTKLKKLKENQIKVRYHKHYQEGNNFIIEGYHPTLVQIVITPSDIVELVGDLLKYMCGNFITRDEES